MKKKNLFTLKEAIDNMLSEYRIDQKVSEVAILNSWEELMGKMIANHTKEIYIRSKKLYIQVDTSVLKNELLMMKTPIMERLNQKAGKTIIEEIIIL